MSADVILVPSDFSEHSARALEYALGLGKSAGARIELLHAFEVPISPTGMDELVLPPDFRTTIRDAAARKLEKSLHAVEAAGLAGEIHVHEGGAAEVIAEHARALDADFVVMGTRGLSGLRHVLLGSVAERTLRGAPCPVITVNEASEGARVPAETVLVPIDFSDPSRAALARAVELAKDTSPSAKLVLAHAFFLPLELEALAIHGPQQILDDISARARAELEKLLAELQDRGIAAEYAARHGSPDGVIEALAREHGADLIVMGTHGRGPVGHALLGSVAERVVRQAPCPVMTLKA